MICLISFFLIFVCCQGAQGQKGDPGLVGAPGAPVCINADIIDYNTTVPLGCPALNLICSIFVEMYYNLIELKSIRSNQDKYVFFNFCP